MDKHEIKEGIVYLLWRTQGSTFDEISDFLSMNKVQGFEEDSPEKLRILLNEMKEEELIEERFMVDGTDRADFALETVGKQILDSEGKGPELGRKWKTGLPSLEEMQSQEGPGGLDEME
jgi:hypothetical protein